jgi:hypothetical protein
LLAVNRKQLEEIQAQIRHKGWKHVY